jgi:hypothetical protein
LFEGAISVEGDVGSSVWLTPASAARSAHESSVSGEQARAIVFDVAEGDHVLTGQAAWDNRTKSSSARKSETRPGVGRPSSSTDAQRALQKTVAHSGGIDGSHDQAVGPAATQPRANVPIISSVRILERSHSLAWPRIEPESQSEPTSVTEGDVWDGAFDATALLIALTLDRIVDQADRAGVREHESQKREGMKARNWIKSRVPWPIKEWRTNAAAGGGCSTSPPAEFARPRWPSSLKSSFFSSFCTRGFS